MLLLLALGLLPALPVPAGARQPAAALQPGNVVIVLLDDVGVDCIGAYGEAPDAAPTPVIDTLAATGVLFRNAWVDPVCSSTRCAILTGRYGAHTGLGKSVGGVNGDFLPSDDEVTLPELLTPAGYACWAVGKWHLGTNSYPAGVFEHPILWGGFQAHLGAISNLKQAQGETYSSWEKNVAIAGQPAFQVQSSTYATSDNVDDALDLIEAAQGQPFFLWLAFNAAHTPLHEPPPELTTEDDYLCCCEPGPVLCTKVKQHRAMVEAADAELGRLIAGIRPAVLARTTIFVLGDNGTVAKAVSPPFVGPQAKGTVYEGGVNVPLIAWGAAVADPGREEQALACGVDLFPTALRLAGRPLPENIDGISLMPYLRNLPHPAPRAYAYAEVFAPNGFGPYDQDERAARDTDGWKLIRDEVAGTQKLFFLPGDPFEGQNLLSDGVSPEERQHLDELAAVLDSIP